MPPGVINCLCLETPMSISFSGSGFMATYQLGVAQCFLNYAPWILKKAPRVFGASAGSLVAAAVVCEMDFTSIRDEMLHFAKQVKTFTLGPLNPSINVFHWLERVLWKYVSEDAHKLACGRLAVAMTSLEDGKQIITTEYQSKKDIIQALLCSCFVPGYCGVDPPSFKGKYYVDGGFTGMQPVHSQSPTLTVCPFSGDMDICPTDAPCLLDLVVSGTTLNINVANCGRVFNALYPTTLESLEEAYDRGYNDAINFLLRNDLAPYLTIHDLTHEKPCLEDTKRDMESVKEENSLTTFTNKTSIQSKRRKEEPFQSLMHLDFIVNVLLNKLMIFETIDGMPGKLLTFMILPLLLVLFLIMQSWHRLQIWFRGSPQRIFWTWAGLRHFTIFFYDICIRTISKNVYDRMKHIMLMVQWLNVQDDADVPHVKWKPVHKTHSLCET